MSVRSTGPSSFRVALLLASLSVANGGAAGAAEIDWSVRNRFPFLRFETDFIKLEAAHRRRDADGVTRHVGVLEAEHRLSQGVNGVNWAHDLKSTADGRVCFDQDKHNGYGGLVEECVLHFDQMKPRKTTYINPTHHLVAFRLTGTPEELDGARCEWTFDSKEVAPFSGPCDEGFSRFVPRKIDHRDGSRTAVTTAVRVKVSRDGTQDLHVDTRVAVRDVLILGMGDSIASGEGNPDRPVELSWGAFCFQRYISTQADRYIRPGRQKAVEKHIPLGCPASGDEAVDREIWETTGADWLWRRCHRSMYGYQMRSALALAIRNPQISVTYVPLGCSGAEIRAGVLGEQDAREKMRRRRWSDGGTVDSQKNVISMLLNLGPGKERVRDVDAVLLSIGANDVGFSGLVADVLLAPGTKERKLMGSVIVDPAMAQRTIETKLRNDFVPLRAFLRSLVGRDLSKVVFTAYADPAAKGIDDAGRFVPCGSGRGGVDIHPALTVDGSKLANTVSFVENTFIPALETLTTCRKAPGSPIDQNCSEPATERMTYVDGHRRAFASHGFCVTSANDPAFDRNCFLANGESFRSNGEDTSYGPLRCDQNPDSFRTYGTRDRWIRTPNDSYFAAMTYPFRRKSGFIGLNEPADIHDAFWGILSSIYGGAIHPTAEGHAAIADAVVPKLEAVLKIAPPAEPDRPAAP